MRLSRTALSVLVVLSIGIAVAMVALVWEDGVVRSLLADPPTVTTPTGADLNLGQPQASKSLPATPTPTPQIEFNITGAVTDEYTGRPVISATVSFRGNITQADSQGRYSLEKVKRGESIVFNLEGYDEQSVSYNGGATVDVALRHNTLKGIVLDASSGKAVPQASMFLGQTGIKAQADGGFLFTKVPRDARLMVLAAGYKKADITIGKRSTLEIKLEPLVVKGIYLTFYTVGWQERREQLFDLLNKTELNAVVMDVKSDRGLVNSAISVPLSKDIGADYKLSEDLREMIAKLKAKGVYTIARIVVFKDAVLATKKPQYAVKDSGTGKVYVDCEDQLWVDPFNRSVWDYNIAMAEQSVRLGFDEIQFDYIRFPSDCIRGSLVYSQEANEESRVAAIEGFLAAAAARLRPLGAFTAADTFGWTTLRDNDMGIGQIVERIGKQVDYFSPMVYPSTWEAGSLDLSYPPAYPYEIVYKSLSRAMERLQDVPTVRIRPWLQDFNDYGPRKLPYGVREINLQKEAAKDAGTIGWMLWDAWVKYTVAALEPK